MREDPGHVMSKISSSVTGSVVEACSHVPYDSARDELDGLSLSLFERGDAVKDGLHTDAQTTRVRRTTFAIARLLRRTDGKPL